ncbi:MAG TPA: hypothetical protein VKA31_02180 [Mariprofundaceae bacterium]|nr:hypothetical protein [Mariprofundaceae bacterium]
MSCDAKFTASGDNIRLCPACRRQKLEQTWKRQMRTYSISMLVGLALVVYAFLQFKAGAFTMNEAPITVFVALALGGLGLMGGLFGFSLALFFSMWHKKKS